MLTECEWSVLAGLHLSCDLRAPTAGALRRAHLMFPLLKAKVLLIEFLQEIYLRQHHQRLTGSTARAPNAKSSTHCSFRPKGQQQFDCHTREASSTTQQRELTHTGCSNGMFNNRNHPSGIMHNLLDQHFCIKKIQWYVHHFRAGA